MKKIKITLIGAGSTIFSKNILGDVFHRPALKDADICLMDINPERLAESELVVKKVAKALGSNANITTETNQKEALRGSDFVVCMFQVGGYEPATVIDFDIPKKYGLEHTIADTLGVGGIMRSLRSVPVHLSIAKDMEEVCPDALMLNYVNPMAMISWAMAEFRPNVKYVGLCHSVQGTAMELAEDLGIPYSDLRYRCAGINHMAFYLNFEQKMPDGTYQNAYPKLLELYAQGKAAKALEHLPRCQNVVRYEMLKHLGYFVTESSEHFSEYTPWFIKKGRPDLIEKYKIPLDEYPKRCIEQIADWKSQVEEFKNSDEIFVEESKEYASTIMNSIVTGEPSVIYGNVPNNGLIDNILEGSSVEVPCLVDKNGIQPTKIGKMPPHLTALISTNVAVQTCFIEALKTENKEHIYHAAMYDPHTAAELSIDEIKSMVDEMLMAHKPHGYMPEWLYK